MNIVDSTLEIRKILGDKNVVYIWFHKDDGLRHNGSANVPCLNPFVYRKFLNKEVKIGAYHVEITPHRRNLEGSEKPSKDLIAKFGFEDPNTCLVNTVGTIQNQTNGRASSLLRRTFLP